MRAERKIHGKDCPKKYSQRRPGCVSDLSQSGRVVFEISPYTLQFFFKHVQRIPCFGATWKKYKLPSSSTLGWCSRKNRSIDTSSILSTWKASNCSELHDDPDFRRYSLFICESRYVVGSNSSSVLGCDHLVRVLIILAFWIDHRI